MPFIQRVKYCHSSIFWSSIWFFSDFNDCSRNRFLTSLEAIYKRFRITGFVDNLILWNYNYNFFFGIQIYLHSVPIHLAICLLIYTMARRRLLSSSLLSLIGTWSVDGNDVCRRVFSSDLLAQIWTISVVLIRVHNFSENWFVPSWGKGKLGVMWHSFFSD
jgi:hypothetical protein